MLKIHKILVVLLLFYGLYDSDACYRAYQLRLFPLGAVSDTIYFLEADLVRNPRLGDRWEGHISVKIFSDGLKAYSQPDSVMIYDSAYSDNLGLYYDSAIAELQGLPGFEGAPPPVAKLCNRKKCGKLKLSADTNNLLTLKYTKKVRHIVEYPIRVLEEILFLGYLKNQPFHIQTYREYKIAGKKFLVTNIGTGEIESTGNLKKQKKYLKYIIKKQLPVYPEITLYHGLCFDVIVPLNYLKINN